MNNRMNGSAAGLAVVSLFVSITLNAQSKPSLEETLLGTRSQLLLSSNGFSGTGAAVLSTAVLEARFVLLGEDHFSREVPRFAAALCDVIHPDAYAVEAGPSAAAFVRRSLHNADRLEQIKQRSKAHPENMAFLDIQEENDLAAHCAAASRNPRFGFWGLDQEFVGAAGTLLEEMVESLPGPRARVAIAAAQVHEREAKAEARRTGKVEKLFLLSSTDEQIGPLREAIAVDGTEGTQAALREFLASRAIYQLHLAGLPEAQSTRASLLKQHFIADYASFKTQTPEGKVFFKFGGMHMGKGFSFIHQLDLGDYVAELADAERTKSLHVFTVGVRGVRVFLDGYGKPLGRETFSMAADQGWEWLVPVVSQVLPPQSGFKGDTLTLFDLRRLRYGKVPLPPEWEHLVYSYDLLVLIPEVTPATLLQ